MADLLTHLAAARMPAAFVRDRRYSALLVIGTFLPDLVSKGLYWVTRAPGDFTVPTHSLAGLLVLSYGAALFVEERLRRGAFLALLAGGLVHVAVDVLKENMGMGNTYFFHPLSTYSFEIGLIDNLNVILLVPVDAAILILAWMLERRRRRVQQ